MQAEIIALRHQLIVLQRTQKPKRLILGRSDRCLWVWLSHLWSRWRSALIIVKPETVIGWHRQGFQWYWTWKIRHGRSGRPLVSRETRDLVRTISRNNPLWGAPRIHGELLKLGIKISQASVAKYMVRHTKPPSQTWRTFLANHVSQLVSIDFFTVHTLWFEILSVLNSDSKCPSTGTTTESRLKESRARRRRRAIHPHPRKRKKPEKSASPKSWRKVMAGRFRRPAADTVDRLSACQSGLQP